MSLIKVNSIEAYTGTSVSFNNDVIFTNISSGVPSASLGIDANGKIISGSSVTSSSDTYVTGGTYSSGTAIFTNNTGGTFSVTGFNTGSSVTSSSDTYVTGGTYSAGTAIFRNNTGGTFSVTGFNTGSSVNYWVSGSTGNFSLKANNDSGLDATGNYAVAEGGSTTASGVYSHAEGFNSVASGQQSHAEGANTTAFGDNSHAEGFGSVASGLTSHAEGSGTLTTGQASHAEGLSSIAIGNYSHAEGSNTIASGITSHAEGITTQAIGYASHAEGSGTLASGDSAHAEGLSSIASGDYSHAEGSYTTASANYSHAEGFNSIATGDQSHAEGSSTIASGNNSHAEGSETVASGDSSHAEGNTTTASGNQSHVEGTGTIASGDNSHAEGGATTASGINSHAEGSSTTAFGDNSHAEGGGSIASGSTSHAEGNATTASGIASHSEGNATIASGQQSHAEGYTTLASGYASHAEGSSTVASGPNSHAEGSGTIASGSRSHAEGDTTIASGQFSHAGGWVTEASGLYSFVHGFQSKASSNGAIVLGNGITGSTSNTVFVNNLVIKNLTTGTSVSSIGVDATGKVISGNTNISDAIYTVNADLSANTTTTATTSVLIYGVNVFSSVTATDYATKLPQPVTGKSVKVINNGTTFLQIFPSNIGGRVNNLPINTAAVIPPDGNLYEFICIKNPLPGEWTFSAPATGQYDSGEITISISALTIDGLYNPVITAYDSNYVGAGPNFNSNNWGYDGKNKSTILSTNINGNYYLAFRPETPWKGISKIKVYTNLINSNRTRYTLARIAAGGESDYYSPFDGSVLNTRVGTANTELLRVSTNKVISGSASTGTTIYTSANIGDAGTLWGEKVANSGSNSNVSLGGDGGTFIGNKPLDSMAYPYMQTWDVTGNEINTGDIVDVFYSSYISFQIQPFAYDFNYGVIPDFKFRFIIEYYQ